MTGMEKKFGELVEKLALASTSGGVMLTAAESCTGGWVAKCCTDLPGSSRWFERGFVTYSNEAKQEMLGVRADTLQRHGAVSEQVVREMAQGALARSRAQVSVAISGIAGPGGETAGKPVGTVWFAWATTGDRVVVEKAFFEGDREQVRAQSVAVALQGLLDVITTG